VPISRGENGQIDVDEGKQLDLYWPITVKGTLWKRERGTLALGGGIKFLSASGELTEDPPRRRVGSHAGHHQWLREGPVA